MKLLSTDLRPVNVEPGPGSSKKPIAGGLDILTYLPYIRAMKSTITSKGQITIPAAIREKLGLRVGQVLDFDESAPFLKAVPAFDEEEMRSVVGCAKGRLGRTSKKWIDETRGRVVVPKGSA